MARDIAAGTLIRLLPDWRESLPPTHSVSPCLLDWPGQLKPAMKALTTSAYSWR